MDVGENYFNRSPTSQYRDQQVLKIETRRFRAIYCRLKRITPGRRTASGGCVLSRCMPAVVRVVVRDERGVDGSGNSQVQRFNGRFSVFKKTRDITVAFRTAPPLHRIRAITHPNNGCLDQYGNPRMALPETSSFHGDDARMATDFVDIHPLCGDISCSSRNDRGCYIPHT